MRLLEADRVDAVNLLVQSKRLGGGQVPPELVLLPHHERKPPAIYVLAFPWHMTHHVGLARGGIDHARKQLERRRFAGAVGPEEGHEFALLDRQVDAAHGMHLAILAIEEARKRRPEAFLLLVDAVRLLQVANFDDRPVCDGRHGPQIIGAAPTAGQWDAPPTHAGMESTQPSCDTKSPSFANFSCSARRPNMSLLSRLESKLGRYAVPNLTLRLIAGQVIVYVLQRMDLPGAVPLASKIALVPDKVLAGPVVAT